MTEDGGQMTDDGRQKTEDRKQKYEKEGELGLLGKIRPI